MLNLMERESLYIHQTTYTTVRYNRVCSVLPVLLSVLYGVNLFNAPGIFLGISDTTDTLQYHAPKHTKFNT